MGEQDDILKNTFKQLISDKEGQHTVGFIMNASQWKVSEKVGSLQNIDDHFIQWLLSVTFRVLHNWSLESTLLTCNFFNLYQIPTRTKVPSQGEEDRERVREGSTKSRCQCLCSNETIFFFLFNMARVTVSTPNCLHINTSLFSMYFSLISSPLQTQVAMTDLT